MDEEIYIYIEMRELDIVSALIYLLVVIIILHNIFCHLPISHAVDDVIISVFYLL